MFSLGFLKIYHQGICSLSVSLPEVEVQVFILTFTMYPVLVGVHSSTDG
jgi:hypothetical protein